MLDNITFPISKSPASGFCTLRAILVFLDDFPYHYFGEELKDLKEFIRALDICRDVYIVATAREDQISDEHSEWLKELKFFEISMVKGIESPQGLIV